MIKKISSIYEKYKEIINYIIVGVLTTMVSIGIFYLCRITILKGDSQLDIQISNIISWLFAVHFAFITNKKYVFGSVKKGKDKLVELIKFDLSRVSTLIIEMICMWILTSPLSIDDKISKLFVQVIVMVLNYIFSKLFVFTNKKNKSSDKVSFLKKNNNLIKIVLFCITLVIFYLAPYTHDDWAWGTQIGLDRLYSLFEGYNGRWVGNLVVLVLTRSRILKAFVISITLYLIIKLIRRILGLDKNSAMAFISMLLLLFMPTGIFAQALAWTSGFSNYVISFVFTLIFIDINKDMFSNKVPNIKNTMILPLFIMGFVAALFLENLTIYNVFLGMVIVLYQFFKNRKIILADVGFLVGSISGAILMFSNSAYHNIANATDGYRTMEKGNIIVRFIKTYFNSMYKYLFQNNMLINVLLGILVLIVVYKFLEKGLKSLSKKLRIVLFTSLFIIVVYMTYLLFMCFNGNVNIFIRDNYRHYIEGIMVCCYYLAIIVTLMISIKDNVKKNKILFYFGSIIILSGPLFLITPFGPRNFFQNYIFYILIICELLTLFDFKNKKYICSIMVSAVFVALISYLMIFVHVYKVELNRLEKIKSFNQTEEVLFLPKLPHENYMQSPNPKVQVFEERFKLFYKIPVNKKVMFYNAKEKK